MKKAIAILITLVFIVAAIPLVTSDTTFDDVTGIYTTEDLVDDHPNMDATATPPYLYGTDDFCWTHYFDPSGKNILSAKLVIYAWDVDGYEPYWQENLITIDGDDYGIMADTGNNMWGYTYIDITDFSLFDDGEIYVCVDIDNRSMYKSEIAWSKLIVEYWIPILNVEKTLEASREVGEDDYEIPEYVPIFTAVEFDMKITVENPDYDDFDELFEDIWISDGIGAKLDLVDQGGYIFKINGTEIPLGTDDTIYKGKYDGEYGYIEWWQANKKYDPIKNPCATRLLWHVGDLDEGESATLEFTVVTIQFQVGPKNDPQIKQAFTSTCHHEINDGPVATYWFDDELYCYWADPVIVSVYDPTPGVDSDLDGVDDWIEVFVGTDPCDEEDYPEFIETCMAYKDADGQDTFAGTDDDWQPWDPEYGTGTLRFLRLASVDCYIIEASNLDPDTWFFAEINEKSGPWHVLNSQDSGNPVRVRFFAQSDEYGNLLMAFKWDTTAYDNLEANLKDCDWVPKYDDAVHGTPDNWIDSDGDWTYHLYVCNTVPVGL